MASSTNIKLAENVYSGGTIVFAEGSELAPEQAHAYGVKKDGTVDRTLGTDELRERLTSGSEPVPALSGTPAGDLTDATAEQVIDYLHANPTEVDRVAEVEGARSSPRKTVMEAVERLRSGG